MRKRTALIWLAGISMILLITGCQKKDKTKEKSIKIYYSAIESGDYYEGWADQLQRQAEAAGCIFDVGYAEKSIEAQDAQVKKAFSDGYQVFLCGLVSPDIAVEIKAAAKGMPIVFINNAPSDNQLEKDRYIYVASDEFMAGQYQAEYLLEKFRQKEEINIVLLKGPKEASGTIGRTEGLKQTLKASGKKINYVFEDCADWNKDTAKELMKLFLKLERPIDCVAANNDDMALGAVEALEEAKTELENIIILGVDASEKGCEAIIDGRMDFTVYQPMSAQIMAAIEAAEKLAVGESIENIEGATKDGKYILLPFEKVDIYNVAQYR
ncbi:MAG: sugar ABC transporter substrate-binding protein [Lachnospiraceae bacterium]|nr:sugar ABC transporter substrate-binding protein [Lachnospiraceae bacterium]